MNSVIINAVKAKDNVLEVSFSCTGRMRKFFKYRKFVAEYNVCIEKTPRSILLVPFLATACPIVWADDAEIFVNECDETFLQSLEVIKKSLQRFYPGMNFRGNIRVNKSVRSTDHAFARSMSLFSGGIDSYATLIRHQAENPILFTVYGKGFAPYSIVKIAMDVSKKNGLELRTVRNNPYSILDIPMLAIYRNKIGGDWYQRVMHGLALLGLCAPITYVDRIGTIYIAASATKEFKQPWGSCPEIDNHVRWSGTNVIHDGFDLSRQQKLFLIADYIRKKNCQIYVHSCNFPNLPKNCGICEKCSRTIVGFELAGIDPTRVGFLIGDDLASSIKENLVEGNWDFGLPEQWLWTDIKYYAKRTLDLPNPEMEKLVEWLSNLNIASIKSRTSKKSSKLKSILWEMGIPLIKYLPYPLYTKFRIFYNRFEKHLHI